MKKRILLMCSFTAALAITSWGQNPAKSLLNAPTVPATEAGVNRSASLAKTTACQDTLHYSYVKEVLLHTTPAAVLNVFQLWQSDNEGFTQTYLLNGSSVNVSGAEFYARRNSASPAATATVKISLYTVNASYVPTTLLTSTTVNISSTTAAWYSVNFPAPVSVNTNYAMVIELTNANPDARLDIVTNNQAGGQSYDENLAMFRSNDAVTYPGSAGNWVPIITAAPTYNFEPIIGAIVNYNVTASYTAPTAVCAGTPVTFTSTSTPASVLSNRMFNFNVFSSYFGLATTDSTYVNNLDNALPFLYGSQTATYTYNTPATYDPELGVFGGFWYSCVDVATAPLTVNAVPATPTVTASGATTICSGGNVVLTSSAATGNVWSNGATTPSITVSTAGSYTTTVTAAGCSSAPSAATTVTVNPADNATFTYTSNTLCNGGSNQTPTVATAGGTFSSTTGLTINASTGEIDMATSTDGTYSVTYTTAGACPGTSTQSITITDAPDASFTYSAASFCTAGTDPMPVFGAGASGGVFNASTGLFLNTSTGAIDLSGSTPGTYTVTNSIAASGACPAASQTFSVTINATPTAVVSGGGTQCGSGTIPVTVTLTGTGPWSFAYSDGTTTTPVTAQATSPFTINATASGTYTVAGVATANGCASVGTGSATVTFNANPTVALSPVAALCADASAVTVTGATPAGGTLSGTGITGNTFDPATAGTGSHVITYSYTDANGCSGSATTTVTVNAVPMATLAALADMCDYNAAITLTGGTPAGGTYSGTGVTGGSFNPATAGTGTHAITYSVTANGCTGTATQSIDVDACLGVDEIAEANLVISPNPATDFILISYTNTAQTDVTLTLTSNDGKLVAYRTIKGSSEFNEKMDVSTFANGLYFVKMTTNNGTVTKKVIVQ